MFVANTATQVIQDGAVGPFVAMAAVDQVVQRALQPLAGHNFTSGFTNAIAQTAAAGPDTMPA